MKLVEFNDMICILTERILENEKELELEKEVFDKACIEIYDNVLLKTRENFNNINIKDAILTYGILEGNSIYIPSSINLNTICSNIKSISNDVFKKYNIRRFTVCYYFESMYEYIASSIWDILFNEFKNNSDMNIEYTESCIRFVHISNKLDCFTSRAFIISPK